MVYKGLYNPILCVKSKRSVCSCLLYWLAVLWRWRLISDEPSLFLVWLLKDDNVDGVVQRIT